VTKVLICVPTAEFARRADFYDYFNALDKPEGTMLTFAHGQSPAKNRNIMIRTAFEQNATHVLFIDDDVLLPVDGLKRLLAHDKDVVSGLYLLRNYPHLPVMFEEWFDDGRCRYAFLDSNTSGLKEVVNIGLGCVLIKTEVLRAMTDPWITLGQIDQEGWSDDVHFFNKVRQAGFRMYVDTDVRCGQVITAAIWPYRRDDGSWSTLYNTGAVESFQVPQIVPTVSEIATAVKKSGATRGTSGND
jgi:hypothetical protein